ncbi:MAG: RNA polymerase sigma factor [Planctomycetes bacterium]|nr:RNA polymerase sigma factor [Planctomycetota bacterium]
MDPDQELVRGLQRREMGCLREAYERHGERVQRLCQRLLGHSADAEDAAQEVFLKLFERAGSFDGRARFSTWLHRLTVNLCLHRLERERLRLVQRLPEDGGLLIDPGETPPETLTRTEARVQLERLLACLSHEHRTVLVLRELEGLSYREIADTLALPEGTVMSRLARAREQLIHLSSLRPRADARPAGRPLLDTP